MNTLSLYDELTRKIGRVRRKEQAIQFQAGLLNALASALTIWTAVISLEALGEFEPSTRAVLYYGAVALSAIAAAWFMAIPAGRYLGVLPGQDDDLIARRVGNRIPEVGDRLVNVLQLSRMMRAQALVAGYSAELAEASIASQGESLRRPDYSIIIEDDRRTRGIFFLLGSLAMLGGLFLAFPTTYGDALYRLTHYDRIFAKPALFSLTIEPGDRRLVRGDSVRINVRADGIPPRFVTLVVQAQGASAADTIELRGDSARSFSYLLPGIKSTTTYHAFSGPVRTQDHTLTMVDRPEIRMLRVSVTAPAYTGHGVDRLPDNMGDVSGIRGSTVNIQVTANISPANAFIVQLFPKTLHLASSNAADLSPPKLYDTVRIPLKVEGVELSGSFRLTRDGEYYIAMGSSEGLPNLSPIHYTMSVSTDGAPSIALMAPTGQADIDETMLLPTQVRISDDYGFSWLHIRYKVTASRYEEPWTEYKTQTIPIPKGSSASLDVPYIWNMTKMSLVPGDEMELYFEVADNDVVAGPKIARTGTITVRFPSLDEVLQNAEQTQAQANAELDKVLKQAQDAKKQMEELNRELMKQLAQNKEGANWQEQQKLQDIMKRHEQMEQKIEEIAENLRAMAEKLREAKAISPETIQKYQELQKLFQDLKDSELRKAMEEMQQAMEKMTPEQMAEAMKNFKFNEEQFRQAIERTMKILQRMQTEQKVDELIRRAEELAKKQEELNQQMENAAQQDKSTRDQLAERQEQLAESAQKMRQETEELSKKMNEMGQQQQDMPTKEMQDARQQLEQNDPGQQMEQAGEQMQQGDMQEAQQKGEQARQSAQDFKQKMQGVKQKMQENGKREVMNKMRKSLQDLLDLSKRQEALKQQTEQTQPNSQQFREQAQQESQMQQDMQNIANQMGEISQKSFAVTPEMGREMGDAMRQMQGATQSLSNRDGFKASRQQGEAMGAMNRAAMMMQEALGQMQGQGQGQGMGMGQGMGSFQQRLQQMAAQQQMINEAMRQQGQQGQQGQGQGQGKQGKNGKDGQGEGEGDQGENGQGEMQRLRQQQGQVKKSVEDLNKEMREAGGTRKNRVGDLDRAAQEIEEVMSDMQSGQVTPETLERQERILSRMLDAMKSERERDFEKERESKPGVDVVRESPEELRIQARRELERLQRDMLRSSEQGYTKDYEYMIRKYFEALGKSPEGAESR